MKKNIKQNAKNPEVLELTFCLENQMLDRHSLKNLQCMVYCQGVGDKHSDLKPAAAVNLLGDIEHPPLQR